MPRAGCLKRLVGGARPVKIALQHRDGGVEVHPREGLLSQIPVEPGAPERPGQVAVLAPEDPADSAAIREPIEGTTAPTDGVSATIVDRAQSVE